ncbi:class I SAM-dependent methyltransferase [Paenibacillus sp. FSL R5-0407]|uniref:class I SAM-dependent methyltransferase n=1 Tax=Paenibacillus TaxID=44249 RepID=UPI0025B67642|nr:class I SAM-dependent methyltransferase [Paenibacillus vini]MDN4068368.1 class I SAM-dependent methyltransferase [Paenibacillus vini]
MTISAHTLLSGLFLIIALLAALSIVFSSWRNGISPMPTSAPVRQAVITELSKLNGIETIIEAGSGWGTLAIQASRLNPGWHIIGIENSPVPLAVSRLISRWQSNRNTVFINKDLYEYAFEEADAVLCYLYPGAMSRLDPIFREKLASGTYVISICFALPGWTPERVVTCRDMYRTKIYLYKTPL